MADYSHMLPDAGKTITAIAQEIKRQRTTTPSGPVRIELGESALDTLDEELPTSDHAARYSWMLAALALPRSAFEALRWGEDANHTVLLLAGLTYLSGEGQVIIEYTHLPGRFPPATTPIITVVSYATARTCDCEQPLKCTISRGKRKVEFDGTPLLVDPSRPKCCGAMLKVIPNASDSLRGALDALGKFCHEFGITHEPCQLFLKVRAPDLYLAVPQIVSEVMPRPKAASRRSKTSHR